MNPKRRRRLFFVVFIVLGIGGATALALTAFRENLLYFYTPSQVANGEAPMGRNLRVGGLVTDGSVQRGDDGLSVRFDITDTAHTITVAYTGILPDLFREGQGVVAIGRVGEDGVVAAEQVLAKHDENYMPPEVTDALKKAGAVSPHPAGSMKP